VCHLAKLVCGQDRSTHYERVQWFTARHGCREMPLATALLAMSRRGRIVRCGDRLGTRQYQLGNTYGPLVGASIERLIELMAASNRCSGHAR